MSRVRVPQVRATREPRARWSTAHEWVGKRVVREFADARLWGLTGEWEAQPTGGVITGWLRADREEAALWHMRHDDGDEEDLEDLEVREALRRAGEDEWMRPVVTDIGRIQEEVELEAALKMSAAASACLPRDRRPRRGGGGSARAGGEEGGREGARRRRGRVEGGTRRAGRG